MKYLKLVLLPLEGIITILIFLLHLIFILLLNRIFFRSAFNNRGKINNLRQKRQLKFFKYKRLSFLWLFLNDNAPLHGNIEDSTKWVNKNRKTKIPKNISLEKLKENEQWYYECCRYFSMVRNPDDNLMDKIATYKTGIPKQLFKLGRVKQDGKLIKTKWEVPIFKFNNHFEDSGSTLSKEKSILGFKFIVFTTKSLVPHFTIAFTFKINERVYLFHLGGNTHQWLENKVTYHKRAIFIKQSKL